MASQKKVALAFGAHEGGRGGEGGEGGRGGEGAGDGGGWQEKLSGGSLQMVLAVPAVQCIHICWLLCFYTVALDRPMLI